MTTYWDDRAGRTKSAMTDTAPRRLASSTRFAIYLKTPTINCRAHDGPIRIAALRRGSIHDVGEAPAAPATVGGLRRYDQTLNPVKR
jgi:hypothetical protein